MYDQLRLLKRRLPQPIQHRITRTADRIDAVHSRSKGIPPRNLRTLISPLWYDFKKTGNDQLHYLIELSDLKPTDRILDIGCGVGRMAFPLTRYLNERGHYDGLDIAKLSIDWCTENVTSRFANFCFTWADVTTQDDKRTHDPAQYRFPYDDESFDLVYAGSLFSHLQPAAAENYLAETARVLRTGGKSVITFILFNRESQRLIPLKSLPRLHTNDYGFYRTMTEPFPELSVSFDESYVRDLHQRCGLTIADPLRWDASYNPSVGPENWVVNRGAHLYYTYCVIAVRESPRAESNL
jgi:SAM-dependent methyltransferase